MRDLVQKALYLGVGIASYAAEKAGANLQELRTQAQKLADELVARGEMTTEEAKRYVEELIQDVQVGPEQKSTDNKPREPRRIEIVFDDQDKTSTESPPPVSSSPQSPDSSGVDELRQQVAALQEELRRMRQQ
jgi:polyhydroxyalkanoate synthesis regulator phasin